MIKQTDAVINSAHVLAELLDEKAEDLSLGQYKELKRAIEACFKIVERRR